jgi:hypothetical protein
MDDKVWMIDSELDGQRCQVAFFESWATYAHPVTPQQPLTLYQALKRPKYHRAWKCDVNGKPLFVLFEAVENTPRTKPGAAQPATGAEPSLSFFSTGDSAGTAGGGSARARLEPGQALRQQSFGVQGLDTTAAIFSFDQKVNISYRYRYKADGRLDTVTIVNPEGQERVLQY